MTRESMESLRTNTVQGYGFKAWHYREGISAEPYPAAIPETVVADMFPTITEVPNGYQTPTEITADGVTVGEWVPAPDHKTLLRADTRTPLAVVGKDYGVHQYGTSLLGMGLPIAAAGILREGRNAWVEYGTADGEVVTADNVEFVTKLLCVTSADASLATQMRYVTTLAVCDNTLSWALAEGADTAMRVRHTRLSVAAVDNMRRAFGLIPDIAEQTAATITGQIRRTVTTAQVNQLLDRLLPNSAPGAVPGRSRSIAENKRAAIRARYNGMWADYTGTAFGILQSIDTASRWDFKKTGDKQEANMRKVIGGDFDTNMRTTQHHLAAILTG
jgi:phage/plasmid-like protein (TIGR03299 family)